MSTFIYLPSVQTIRDDLAHRKICILSDGSLVTFVRTAQTTITAYHSSNRTSWTSKFTITVSTQSPFSAAIDHNDNIQCVYQTTNGQNLFWKRFAYSAGPAWTGGTAESIVADANNHISYCDIDILGVGGASACIVVYRKLFGSFPSGTHGAFAKARGSSGSWGTEVNLVGSSAYTTINAGQESISCSSDKVVPAGTTQRVYISGVLTTFPVTRGGFDGSGLWDTVSGANSGSFVASADTFTEHISNGSAAPNIGNQVYTFASSPDNWYGVEFYNFRNNTCQVRAWHSVWNGSVLYKVYTSTASMPASTLTTATRPTAILMGNGKIACFARYTTGTSCLVIDVVRNLIYTGFNWFKTSNPLIPFAGQQRNITTIADTILQVPTLGSSVHEENHVPTAPSIVYPGASQIVNTDLPTLISSLPTLQGDPPFPRKAHWTIANDSGFTTSVIDFAEDETYYDITPQHTSKIDIAHELSQGIKYERVKTEDIFGRISSWTSTISFQVFHPPTSYGYSPQGNTSVKYDAAGILFNWEFSDTSPTDTQTAYQVIVERNSDGTVIVDTGKITSTDSQGVVVISAGDKNVDLRWKVTLWDSDDVQGPFSDYQIFRTGDPPVVTITLPANAGTVDNPAPIVTWTFTGSDSRQEVYWNVIFKDVSGNIIWNSSTQTGPETSYQVPNAILANAISYSVTVTAWDSYLLIGSDTNTFITSWTPPASPIFSIATTNYQDSGYVDITWTHNEIDTDFQSYRVYRRIQGDTVWSMVHESTSDITNYLFQDWLIRSNTPYQYVVTQVANRFGVPIESVFSTAVVVTPSSTNYWLLHPTDISLNFKLSQVTSESFTDEYESEALNIIGRGRKVDYGSYWGHSGNLDCQIWDQTNKTARQIRLELEQLQASKSEVFLRNPFGDLWLVDIGNSQIDRVAGVGLREFHTLQLPYQELDVENDPTFIDALNEVLIYTIDGGEVPLPELSEVDGGSP